MNVNLRLGFCTLLPTKWLSFFSFSSKCVYEFAISSTFAYCCFKRKVPNQWFVTRLEIVCLFCFFFMLCLVVYILFVLKKNGELILCIKDNWRPFLNTSHTIMRKMNHSFVARRLQILKDNVERLVSICIHTHDEL